MIGGLSAAAMRTTGFAAAMVTAPVPRLPIPRACANWAMKRADEIPTVSARIVFIGSFLSRMGLTNSIAVVIVTWPPQCARSSQDQGPGG